MSATVTTRQVPAQAGDLVARRARELGVPTWVSFQVTDRCNYDCSHCYQTHGRDPELSLDEIGAVLDDLAASGVLFLTLLGGEFFMRRDADNILAAARARGFAVKLITTGHHIDDARADRIAALGAIEVRMSLYSSRHGPHDALTRVPGSWERTVAAARRLVARRVPVGLQTPLMDFTGADLDALEALAASLGARLHVDAHVTARTDGDTGPTGHRPSMDALRGFLARRAGGPRRNADGDTPCRAAEAVCAITPQGDVRPCLQLPLSAGNLRERRFLDIWRTSPVLEHVRRLTWGALSECDRCAVRPYCSRCHAMALTEDGRIDGPSLECCRQAVAYRDALRDRGMIPATETALPPTWPRVLARDAASRGVRSAGLKVLP
ncbi:MAG: radical SAM protein [Deltaproteobacteria bacterium]|nr:MAG: radical SAM protein [Deltaproteobacteria bacterium]